MECPRCHRYGGTDRETGYDVDTLCPECEAFEETVRFGEHCDWCDRDVQDCICYDDREVA